jgi:hypothetical protein
MDAFLLSFSNQSTNYSQQTTTDICPLDSNNTDIFTIVVIVIVILTFVVLGGLVFLVIVTNRYHHVSQFHEEHEMDRMQYCYDPCHKHYHRYIYIHIYSLLFFLCYLFFLSFSSFLLYIDLCIHKGRPFFSVCVFSVHVSLFLSASYKKEIK